MFATLKRTNSNSNGELVYVGRSAHSEYERRNNITHLACKACQSKKVKCSGHAGGCTRCRARKLECVYAKSARGSKRAAAGVAARSADKTHDRSQSQSSMELSPPLSEDAAVATGDAFAHHQPADGQMEAQHESFHASPTQLSPVSRHLPDTEERASGLAQSSTVDLGQQEDGSSANVPWYLEAANLAGPDAMPLELDGMLLDNSMAGMCPGLQVTSGPIVTEMEDPANAISIMSNNCDDPHEVISSTEDGDAPVYANINTDGDADESSGSNLSPRSFEELASSMFSDFSRSQVHPTMSVRSSTPSPCQCVSFALVELENLQKLNSGHDRSTFDRLLVLKKKTIMQCNRILDCGACFSISDSAIIMLLAVICEKLTVSFCNWANRYAGLRPDPRAVQDADADGFRSRAADNVKRFHLGGYEVDSTEEQCSLLRSLALVQLRNLRVLMARLRSTSSLAGWAAHRAMLLTVDRHAQDATTKLLERETIEVELE